MRKAEYNSALLLLGLSRELKVQAPASLPADYPWAAGRSKTRRVGMFIEKHALQPIPFVFRRRGDRNGDGDGHRDGDGDDDFGFTDSQGRRAAEKQNAGGLRPLYTCQPYGFYPWRQAGHPCSLDRKAGHDKAWEESKRRSPSQRNLRSPTATA